MASRQHTPESPLFRLRHHVDATEAPEQYARLIRNFQVTDEDTLRSIRTPAELFPRYYLDASGYTEVGGSTFDTSTYPMNGIYHGQLGEHNSRDITLVHTRGTVYELRGWNQPESLTRVALYGQGISTGLPFSTDFPGDTSRSKFLTQFLRLPTGILVIPQGARAAVYDGQVMTYLGYDRPPQAPTILQPQDIVELDDGGGAGRWFNNSNTEINVPNGGGYDLSRRWTLAQKFSNAQLRLPHSFGTSRIGSLVRFATTHADLDAKKSNPNGGILLDDETQVVAQWLSVHGDYSPVSEPSESWTISGESNLTKERRRDEDEPAENLRHQIGLSDIPIGPDGTTGRIIGRRKLRSSGDPDYYEVPGNVGGNTDAVATLDDNSVRDYSINTPDSTLLVPVTYVDPVPLFRLACLAMGRLWIANVPGNEGLVRGSMTGRWGSFETGKHTFYPDAVGNAVTGLSACTGGLLVFTERSTFIIEPSDADAERFRARSLNSKVGCVGPNTIQTLPDGTVIWMSREGFHAYNAEQGVHEVSMGMVKQTLRRRNPNRWHRAVSVVDADLGVYRCWCALDADDRNAYGFEYDGMGFRELTHFTAVDAACVADDGRILVLGSYPVSGGSVTGSFVMNRHAAWTREYAYTSPAVAAAEVPTQPSWLLRTHWFQNQNADRRTSAMTVRLRLRMTREEGITVRAYRDGRWANPVSTHLSTASAAPLRRPEDEADNPVLGTSVLGEKVENKLTRNRRGSFDKLTVQYHERRKFTTEVDVTIPACETFALELEGSGDFEFDGISYVHNPTSHAGGQTTPGGKR